MVDPWGAFRFAAGLRTFASKLIRMLSIDPKQVPVARFHGLMLGAVGPRPIAFASTIDSDGKPNLSPFSFFNVFSANPPILIFSPARRVRDNTVKHTLLNVKSVKEVVINIVNYQLVQQASLSSTEFPEGVNEFEKAGLTMLASDMVRPFRVAESPVQFECRVREVVSLGQEGGAGNLVVAEVLKMHIDGTLLDEEGRIDQFKIDLVARMGGNWYTRSRMGMFEVPKPLSTIGIGVDGLPTEIRQSRILTGNDLGILGNTEQLPTEDQVAEYLAEYPETASLDVESRHQLAKEKIEKNNPGEAWKILMAKKK